MSIVKSLAVGDGDMYYIRHNSDNFTIIDCSLSDETEDVIIGEIQRESRDKGVRRFISTHPDDDHICGLCQLDGAVQLLNFYCVANQTTKPEWTHRGTIVAAARAVPGSRVAWGAAENRGGVPDDASSGTRHATWLDDD